MNWKKGDVNMQEIITSQGVRVRANEPNLELVKQGAKEFLKVYWQKKEK